jgi:hypothetical protein
MCFDDDDDDDDDDDHVDGGFDIDWNRAQSPYYLSTCLVPGDSSSV